MSEQLPPASGTTKPETPHAKRLSVPDFSLPDNPTRDELVTALSNILFQIGENLRYLRLAEERREHQGEANDRAILQHEEAIRDLQRRVAALEGEVRQT